VIVRRGQEHTERGVQATGARTVVESPSSGPPGASKGRWNPGSGSGSVQ
jgi:hypothetical protein